MGSLSQSLISYALGLGPESVQTQAMKREKHPRVHNKQENGQDHLVGANA